MAIELIHRWHTLDLQFPNFAKSCMLVSCEQEVEDISKYVSYEDPEHMPKVDKEHVLVCVNVKIDGRFGVLLADPGFHVGQIITVMLDEADPHTGCIVQLEAPDNRKEFHYNFNDYNTRYVEWHEKRISENVTTVDTALIYIDKPFLEGINVTIRRNLVYEFKSLLGRDKDGQITSGIYFKVRKNEKQFTILETLDDHRMRKTKYDFELFAEGKELPEVLKKEVDHVNTILNLKDGELDRILHKVATILKDEMFVDQMNAINEYILKYIPETNPGSNSESDVECDPKSDSTREFEPNPDSVRNLEYSPKRDPEPEPQD